MFMMVIMVMMRLTMVKFNYRGYGGDGHDDVMVTMTVIS